MVKELAPAPFAPQTAIHPHPQGIHIIVAYAPQVSMIVDLTLDQLKAALEQCLHLRKTAGLVDTEAVKAMLTRKDLHTV